MGVDFASASISAELNIDTFSLGSLQIANQEFGEITQLRGIVFYDVN